MNHHHRHAINGHDDEGADSKVEEASRSFTGLEVRRLLEVAALPLVVVALVVGVVVAVVATTYGEVILLLGQVL